MILNKEFVEDKKYKRIMEKIAISNFKEEMEMKNSKNKKIITGFLSTCALFIICGIVMVTNLPSKELANLNNREEENINVQKDNLSITKTLASIDKDKIVSYKNEKSENTSFMYKPNVENLYKYADIVIIGSFDSNINSFVDGVEIYTETKFNTIQVLKNVTELDVSKDVIFNRCGGIMTLDKYMADNDTIRPDEFTNIPENERNEYYVIHSYGPDNKLDFSSSDKNRKYILFLNLNNGRLGLNSSYYGIREINSNNQVYDYDTDTFIDSDLIK